MKTKKEQLIYALSESVRCGEGIHTSHELAAMLCQQNTPAFRKFLSDCTKNNIIKRIASGIYESAVTPSSKDTAIYKLAKKIRAYSLSYISLETELLRTGDILKTELAGGVADLTVMTTGRSGTFKTEYGVIEFIHTKKNTKTLLSGMWYDSRISMHRASRNLAATDLKSCNRAGGLLDHLKF